MDHCTNLAPWVNFKLVTLSSSILSMTFLLLKLCQGNKDGLLTGRESKNSWKIKEKKLRIPKISLWKCFISWKSPLLFSKRDKNVQESDALKEPFALRKDKLWKFFGLDKISERGTSQTKIEVWASSLWQAIMTSSKWKNSFSIWHIEYFYFYSEIHFARHSKFTSTRQHHGRRKINNFKGRKGKIPLKWSILWRLFLQRYRRAHIGRPPSTPQTHWRMAKLAQPWDWGPQQISKARVVDISTSIWMIQRW